MNNPTLEEKKQLIAENVMGWEVIHYTNGTSLLFIESEDGEVDEICITKWNPNTPQGTKYLNEILQKLKHNQKRSFYTNLPDNIVNGEIEEDLIDDLIWFKDESNNPAIFEAIYQVCIQEVN